MTDTILDRDRRFRRLDWVVAGSVHLIRRGTVTRSEALLLAKAARSLSQRLFPQEPELYERLYAGSFRQAVVERYELH